MEIEPSQVHKMLDLVNYQEGSIVSRMLINKKSGSVTLFAFDDKQRLSEHTAPFDALVHILEGEAKINISGKMFILKHGDSIIMPENIPHAVEAIRKFKMILTMIKS